jgi:flagellin
MLQINDNASALNAANNLDTTDTELATVVGQLSSGLQIQTAADNPAGYSIAQNLQYEINGYGASINNAQTAVSVLQTADGAMNQQEAILQQMNTLSTQAANSNIELNTTAAQADQAQFNALVNQLDQISSSTSYAGISLLAGTSSGSSSLTLTFQIGPTATSANQVTISINVTSSASLGVSGLSVTTAAGAASAMASVQAAINSLASFAAVVGATQNQIEALSSNITVAQQNLQAAHANLVDVNVASATSAFTSLQILEQSGVSVLSQAQQLPQLALKLI